MINPIRLLSIFLTPCTFLQVKLVFLKKSWLSGYVVMDLTVSRDPLLPWSCKAYIPSIPTVEKENRTSLLGNGVLILMEPI